jgi:hypothetical protein
MKRFSFILMILLALFVITGCPEDDDNKDDNKNTNGYTTNPTRKFWAQNMITDTFYQITAEKLAENDKCVVWAEKGSGVTTATANSVAKEYSNTIYPKMMNTFGWQTNDPDLGLVNVMQIAHYFATRKTKGAKLTILLLDIKDGYTTQGDAYVGGYFYFMDLFEKDPNYPDIKSNELDMIYMDTYPSVPGTKSSYETLAHEMQHLINFISSLLIRSSDELKLMEIWIDEGLSTAAEWVYSGEHPEDRWKYYNEDPSGLIKTGNNFYLWNNHKDNPLANLDDYATAYLFFQYLRLQSINDKTTDIYFDIATSEFPDYRAVITAEDINSIHKNNWSLLLRDWHAANHINSSTGRYCYKNDPVLKNVKAPMVPADTTTVNLYPGEGVYSKTTSAGTLPTASGNIKYAGLGTRLSSSIPSDIYSTANGALLTYNVNTNKEGSYEAGSTTGIAPSVGISINSGNASVQMLSKNFSGPFKVDASYFIRKNGNKGVSDINIRSVINKNNGMNGNKNNNILKFDKSKIERVFINE